MERQQSGVGVNSRPKILVVEDDDNTSQLICEILEREGYQTRAAWNGEQAQPMAEEESPDLIIMNVVMPRLDGFQACQKLRNNAKTNHIPVIFLTGQAGVDQIVFGYDLDADHYILKPFHPEVFLAQVRRSLRGAKDKATAAILRTSRTPKVFISYKWESDAHGDWVIKLAVGLRSAGIEVFLDRWEVRLGDSFTEYMTSKISEADVVLFVMTTASVEAVEAGSGKGGAVKFELQLASSRRLAGENLRIIPIYREGHKTAAHLRDHRYADFRDDLKYENTLQMLVMDLLGVIPAAPSIGKGRG
jgi:DNA-binding response OmpR family regulator